MRRVGKRLPDFFRRVAQFSNENERPLLFAVLPPVLSYLRPAGRTRCVLLAIGHLSSPTSAWISGSGPGGSPPKPALKRLLIRESLQQVTFRREFQPVGLADIHL